MEFDVLRTAASGMDAQRIALDVAAHNVAAAETDAGDAFTRLVPRFAMQEASSDADVRDVPDDADEGFGEADAEDEDVSPIRFLGTQARHDAHVDAVTEMVAVLDAQRAYEANASVFEDGKRLMERTIDLGRM